MSLLSQMYPSAAEALDRRSGPRMYMPSYNLCRHITLPEPSTYYDPKPDPVRVEPLGDGVYRTSHGILDKDLMDQFARHCQWKSNSQLNYVIHHPPYDDYTKPMPGLPAPASLTPDERLALKSLTFHNIRLDAPREPCEWQQVMQNIGSGQQPQLPETKARLYEPPKRTPGRNPPNWTSSYQAEYNRSIPSREYNPPLYPQTGQASNTISRVAPSCPYSMTTQRSNVDDLPMPWNFSKTPHDPRLISGYQL